MVNWSKRVLIGIRKLDKLPSGHQMHHVGYRKWWKDGTSCFEIMTYIEIDGKLKPFWPLKFIQVTWNLAGPYLKLFKLRDSAICDYFVVNNLCDYLTEESKKPITCPYDGMKKGCKVWLAKSIIS